MKRPGLMKDRWLGDRQPCFGRAGLERRQSWLQAGPLQGPRAVAGVDDDRYPFQALNANPASLAGFRADHNFKELRDAAYRIASRIGAGAGMTAPRAFCIIGRALITRAGTAALNGGIARAAGATRAVGAERSAGSRGTLGSLDRHPTLMVEAAANRAGGRAGAGALRGARIKSAAVTANHSALAIHSGAAAADHAAAVRTANRRAAAAHDPLRGDGGTAAVDSETTRVSGIDGKNGETQGGSDHQILHGHVLNRGE